MSIGLVDSLMRLCYYGTDGYPTMIQVIVSVAERVRVFEVLPWDGDTF